MRIADRTIAPQVYGVEKITLPKIDRLQLSNGIQVHCINAGVQEVTKIEIMFDGGRWQEPLRSVAAATSKTILDGTKSKTSQQISEAIEFFGASVNADAAIDYSHITLFTLTKHLPSLLPLLHEVISEASFPERELNTYIQNSKQRLMVNLQKVDFLAHKEFNERLYGKLHPNGYTTAAEDYDFITNDVLQKFHAQVYKQGGCKIIIAGKAGDAELKLLDDHFGKDVRTHSNGKEKIFAVETTRDQKFWVEKNDSVQSAIRIGRHCINKQHTDFPSMRVLNTIFGGYFGSRLMQNLREEKGYCYGVHSSLISFQKTAHLSVSTEVGKDVTQAAVNEIYNELNRLRTEIIPEEELQLVKNYLLGVILADADGAFNVAEIVRGLVVYDQTEKNFYESIEKIKSVTSNELQVLAQKYFDPQTMIEVVAGAK
ncbi:MAG: insulinase family protein [Chitinophagales bacterium]|nr:insulinase family protein [Chitinophagales bacterium]